ncbi:MAG: GAF domain-containing protein [Pseudomonadota bacterium]
MDEILKRYPFRCTLSFRPLFDYLRKRDKQGIHEMPCPGFDIDVILKQAPELSEPITDLSVLTKHQDLIRRFMSFVFPPVFWDKEAVAALIPFSMKPIFVSPDFARLFLDDEGILTGKINVGEERFALGRTIRAYLFILKKFYGITQHLDYPIIRIVEDRNTGLERHYKMNMDFRFVDVKAEREPEPLSETERTQIMEHLTDPELLKRLLPPENFELCGFSIIQAVDVTEMEVISSLGRDLIHKKSILSKEGFLKVQQRLRTLFRRPTLIADLSAIHENQILSINSGSEMTRNCIFADSHHVHLSELRGTMYEKAIISQQIVRISDVITGPMPEEKKASILKEGIHSLMIAPLIYKDRTIGILGIGSQQPMDLTPLDELLVEQVQPLFSMAIKKALDDFENQIESVIKEQCTAIHPAVEWRFRKAAVDLLENRLRGKKTEMGPIVFKDVFPFYGISDIRGSAMERNRAIQLDLIEHLDLALHVVQQAQHAKPLFILGELIGQIESRLTRIQNGLKSGDDVSILTFLREEVETHFQHFEGFGPTAAQAVNRYRSALDPKIGTVYRLRQDFEESVSILAGRLALILDQEEQKLQSVFPHYFDWHRTDGIDYLIYVGASMNENGELNTMYLKNLRLWQIRIAAMLARQSEELKSELKVPLETAHLILVQDSPMAIRFRFDEKRFDVDGAYNIRNEIIKSRIDKAVVKGSDERLTQPGKIAIVYSHPLEARETLRHIEFLKSEGYLIGEAERIDLEDLPGVHGLKAIRIRVNLDSENIMQTTGSGTA